MTTTASRTANADDAPPSESSVEEARRLFRAAVEREDAGDLAGAVSLYREALAHAVSPQLLFNIASCEDRLDRLVASSSSFREAARVAEARGNEEVLREARARLQEIEKVTPRFLVRAPANQADAEIQLEVDGSPRAVSSNPILVDPGEHHLFARAADGATFEITIAVRRGDTRTVDITFPTNTAGAPAPTAAPAAETAPTITPSPPSALPILIAGSATAVLASFAVGTFVAGHAKKERYVALNETPTRENEAERIALSDEGTSLYTASTVLTVGAAAAGAATVVFVVRWLTGRNAPARAITTVLVPSARGIDLIGKF